MRARRSSQRKETHEELQRNKGGYKQKQNTLKTAPCQERLNLTHLHIFQTILLADTPQHILLATLLHLPREQQLVEDKVRLLEVENDIQLAHVPVVLVHLLDVAVDDFERDQLVVRRRAACDEEQRGIAAVDYLCVCNWLRVSTGIESSEGIESTYPCTRGNCTSACDGTGPAG